MVSLIIIIDITITNKKINDGLSLVIAMWGETIQLKQLALRYGSNWKQKLKIVKVWISLERYFKALAVRKKLKGCTFMNNVTSHFHLNGHFSNL